MECGARTPVRRAGRRVATPAGAAHFARASENFDHTPARSQAATREARQFHVDDRAIEFRQAHSADRGGLRVGAEFFAQIRREFLAWGNRNFVEYACVVWQDDIAMRHGSAPPAQPSTPFTSAVPLLGTLGGKASAGVGSHTTSFPGTSAFVAHDGLQA